MRTKRLHAIAMTAAFACCTGARAQQAVENHLDALARAPTSTTTITPIFGQLLMFSMPKGFEQVTQVAKDGAYLQESVPAGQSALRWTEMIKVTGEKDAAGRPGVTPQRLAEGVAGYFRQLCPDSFAAASFGPVKIERNDGFATILSCGTIDKSVPQSETLMLITIKGDSDMYTLQWAELGAPSKTALAIDAARWQDRLSRIAPVRLCAIVPDEKPPYPTCTNKR